MVQQSQSKKARNFNMTMSYLTPLQYALSTIHSSLDLNIQELTTINSTFTEFNKLTQDNEVQDVNKIEVLKSNLDKLKINEKNNVTEMNLLQKQLDLKKTDTSLSKNSTQSNKKNSNQIVFFKSDLTQQDLITQLQLLKEKEAQNNADIKELEKKINMQKTNTHSSNKQIRQIEVKLESLQKKLNELSLLRSISTENDNKKLIYSLIKNLNTEKQELVLQLKNLKKISKSKHYRITAGSKRQRSPQEEVVMLPKKQKMFTKRKLTDASSNSRQVKKLKTIYDSTDIFKYNDVLDVWHLFDRKHDFNDFSIYSNRERKFENDFKSVKNISILTDLCYHTPFTERDIATFLLKHTYDKNNNLISNFILYVKIFYTKSEDSFELFSKAVDTVKEKVNVPQKLKNILFKSQENAYYLQDIGIGNIDGNAWKNFKKHILKDSKSKPTLYIITPFEKLWDPAGGVKTFIEESLICSNEDIINKNNKRINKNFNKGSNSPFQLDPTVPIQFNPIMPSVINETAFRPNTYNNISISFECNQRTFKGIKFIIKNVNSTSVISDINAKFANLLTYLNENDTDFFNINVNDANSIKCVIQSEGFSVANIGNAIEKLFSNQLDKIVLETFRSFQTINYRDGNKLLAHVSPDNKKTLILMLMVYILKEYKRLSNDVIEDILYDFKKSGDWGQALYCKYKNEIDNEQTLFISGDWFAAFYAILNGVPTIMNSSTPKPLIIEDMQIDEVVADTNIYNELALFTGYKKFEFEYFEDTIKHFLQNDLFTLIKEPTLSLIKTQLTILQTNVINELNAIKTLLTQNDAEYLLTNILKTDKLKNILKIFLNFIQNVLTNIYHVSALSNIDAFLLQFFETMQAEIVNTKQIMVENTCYGIMNNFREVVSSGFDILYVIYIYYIDNDLQNKLKTFSSNVFQFFVNTMIFTDTSYRARLPTVQIKDDFFNIDKKPSWLRKLLMDKIKRNNGIDASTSLQKKLDNISILYKILLKKNFNMILTVNDIIQKIVFDLLTIYKKPIFVNSQFFVFFKNEILQKLRDDIHELNIDEFRQSINKIPNRKAQQTLNELLAKYNNNYIIVMFNFILETVNDIKNEVELDKPQDRKKLSDKIKEIEIDIRETMQNIDNIQLLLKEIDS
jgi:hypothetical protein